MKKIVIIFLSMIVLSLSLVLPSFAVMTDSFGSYTNLFDPSDVVQARFYTSRTFYQDNNFYLVNLDPDTDYTFISTSGTSSLYIGSLAYIDGYISTFNFENPNLINPKLFVNHLTSYDPITDTLTLTKGSGNNRFSAEASLNLPSSTYRISLDYSGSADYMNLIINGSAGTQTYVFSDQYGLSNSYTYTGSITSIQFFLDSAFASGTSADAIHIYLRDTSNSSSYLPFTIEPIYTDTLTYVYNFKTPSSITSDSQILVGINDVLAGSTTNQFSYNQSSENEFYLVEGSLTPDQIADVLQQDRFNQGYNQGYKEGEFDGLNSTKFMNSTLLTAISAPFVIVSSALNFDLFGINFYHILQVLFTLLLVAFVVTKLKGRE